MLSPGTMEEPASVANLQREDGLCDSCVSGHEATLFCNIPGTRDFGVS